MNKWLYIGPDLKHQEEYATEEEMLADTRRYLEEITEGKRDLSMVLFSALDFRNQNPCYDRGCDACASFHRGVMAVLNSLEPEMAETFADLYRLPYVREVK